MGLFSKKIAYATLELNARLQPFHRETYFEKNLGKALKKAKAGRVDGGGTLMSADGEPERVDVNFDIYVGKEQKFIEFIKHSAQIIPKGSRFYIDDEAGTEFELGEAEGLAIYLNGTELPMEVYESCDINVVIQELIKSLGDAMYYFSHFHGNKETALYFYGASFDIMNERIAEFVGSYPLCQNCRIVRIA